MPISVTPGRGIRRMRVAAGDHLPATALSRGRVGGHGGERLIDHAGGEPEVARRAVGTAEAGERVEHAPLEVLHERRLERDHAGLLDADRGGDDRLVGAALRGQRDA